MTGNATPADDEGHKGVCVDPANLIKFCQFISCSLAEKEPGLLLIITALLIADAPSALVCWCDRVLQLEKQGSLTVQETQTLH